MLVASLMKNSWTTSCYKPLGKEKQLELLSFLPSTFSQDVLNMSKKIAGWHRMHIIYSAETLNPTSVS